MQTFAEVFTTCQKKLFFGVPCFGVPGAKYEFFKDHFAMCRELLMKHHSNQNTRVVQDTTYQHNKRQELDI